MYAISLLLLLGAIVTLAIGFVQGGLALIFVSIGASVASAAFLAIGVLRRRPLQPATAGAPYGPAEGTAAASTAPAARQRTEAAGRRPPESRPATKGAAKPAPRTPATASPASPAPKVPAKKAAKKRAAKKPSTKKRAAKKSAAKKPAAKKASASAKSSRSQVMALPERGTFHEKDCRFVKGKDDAERVTLGTARKRGYTPCGVCKPA